MPNTTLGVFESQNDADHAVTELKSRGFNAKDISIVMKEPAGYVVPTEQTVGQSVAEGAVTGASTGTILGGLAGLLIGVGALAIPGIGGLLIGGPLAAALGLTGVAATTVSGAATGAAAGGLLGALVGLGLPEEEAGQYVSTIEHGGVLIAVSHDGSKRQEVETVMRNHGAGQVSYV